MHGPPTDRGSAICAKLAHLACMKTPKPGRILKTMQQQAHRGHGPVYRWLRANYQEIQDGFAQTNAPWDSVVASLVHDGVSGRHDADPNARSVAKVWNRVCRDLKQETVERLTGIPARKRQPSQMPASWQPPVTAPAARPSRGEASSTHNPLPDGSPRERTPEEKVAAIRQQLAQRSGR